MNKIAVENIGKKVSGMETLLVLGIVGGGVIIMGIIALFAKKQPQQSR